MKRSIKILAIGNSFSIDAMEYLWHILRAGGVEEVVLGDLFIGGCPVDLHAQNIKDNARTYIYLKNTDGVWHQTPEASLTDGLLDEDWDIVTLQQASHDSGLPETYAPQDEVLDYIKAHRPHARIYWHMTWAYQKDSTHPAFPRYGCDQAAMYQAILNAVQTEILTRPAYVGVIPSGIAIQNLRATPVSDTVTRDGFHLSESHGRYTAALTWAQTLCGVDPATVDWMPEAFADAIRPDLAYIRGAVRAAGDTFPV
ncbi:MAG: DUF4886 domain-containing protein [Ruminococcaceae bacterium]|nr:DUF4886 domain-containing protein [Oscillospiraceae bacterium]